jgi:hypothetical protein
LIGQGVIVYLDDISIYSETFAKHIELLEEVLRRIRNAGLYIKPKKCQIAMEQMEYLGFIVGRDGVKTDPKKVQAIATYPKPQNTTEVRAFNGLAQFYRRFIRDFSTKASPLYMLLKKDMAFKWEPAQERAFETIKKEICRAPVLARPDFESTKPFVLYTDACCYGLGAILAQEERDSKVEHVIAYASKGTNEAQRNYGATKLECLAVIWAVDLFRHYLVARRFTLVTDHSALRWLFNITNPQGIYARWIMKLQEYDINVVYRAGRNHGNVDALSRIPRHRLDENPNNHNAHPEEYQD